MQFAQIDFEGQNTAEQKKCARAFFKALRAKYSVGEKVHDDNAICKNLLSFIRMQKAKQVLMFYPIKNEPDILPIFDTLVSEDIKVAFPISVTDTCKLKFFTVNSLEDMVSGEYGIPEPPQVAHAISDFSDTVCIVPALAYDAGGARLGYGKGYYDRFLSDFNGISTGVAYSDFVVKKLPCDKFDVPLDVIITQKEVIFTNE